MYDIYQCIHTVVGPAAVFSKIKVKQFSLIFQCRVSLLPNLWKFTKKVITEYELLT